MKILILNYEFPPIGGGGGHVSAEIARELVIEGHTVHVITSACDTLPRHEVIEGYTVQRVPVLRRHRDRCSILEMIAYILLSLLPVLWTARKFKPDIVNAHFGIPTGPLALMVRLLLGYPYVLTIHAGDVPGFMPDEVGMLHQLLLPITRLIWRRSARVVAVSAGIRRMAHQSDPSLTVDVIHNGIRRVAAPEIKRDFKKPLKFMFVGRLANQKGVNYLLEALGQITSEDWILTIVGDGPRRPLIEELILEFQLSHRVSLLGWLDHAEVKRLYQKHDIFVLPSVTEGMPIVVLEAMLFGMPIIGTDVNGTQDLIASGRNGWLVAPQQSTALAAAIQAALSLSPEDLKTMGLTSQELVYQDFTWDVLVKHYSQLFQTIIDGENA